MPDRKFRLICLSVLMAIECSTTAQDRAPWPQGRGFPLMMYEVPDSAATNVTAYGWYILQNYGLSTPSDNYDYLQGLLSSSAAGVAAIPADDTAHPYVGWQDSEVQPWLQEVALNPNLVWWSLPEELQPSIASEVQILGDYQAWARAYDPQLRPIYEYTPNGMGATEISQIMPNVDVIGIGCYCEYIGLPHAWVRYAVQDAGIKGIALAGETIGNNYLAGQKTPVAVLYCAQSIDGNTIPPTMPTASQSYHDFWSAIASGARGISVFSYGHALTDDPSLVDNLNQLNLAASQITGPERIGDMVLYGTPNTNVAFSIIYGPEQTVAFQPPSESSPIQYPSVNVLSKTWAGNVYVIAVNSTEEWVAAVITNLPSAAASADLPFESYSVTVTDGGFTDWFAPWGVHIYKLQAQPFVSQFAPMGSGLFQFVVTNSGASSYTVLTSTNLTDWSVVGSGTQIAGGVYQFTDPDYSNRSSAFYRLRWP